jgi:hypothetical protein
MAWKIEKWFTEVFPGKDRIYEEYRHLTNRELAIVSAAVLDTALAELLSKRVVDFPGEYEEFLGLDGDGRAPVGTFGARIQLALLVGLIRPGDAAVLRAVKAIRNVFSHRVKITFLSKEIQNLSKRLLDILSTQSLMLWKEDSAPRKVAFSTLKKNIPIHEEAGAGLLLTVFAIYQAYFHRLNDMVSRIEGMSVSANGA